jgi:hypothetical protein
VLFAAGDAGNLGQSQQDAVAAERVDQRCGDAAGEGGKALGASPDSSLIS